MCFERFESANVRPRLQTVANATAFQHESSLAFVNDAAEWLQLSRQHISVDESPRHEPILYKPVSPRQLCRKSISSVHGTFAACAIAWMAASSSSITSHLPILQLASVLQSVKIPRTAARFASYCVHYSPVISLRSLGCLLHQLFFLSPFATIAICGGLCLSQTVIPPSDKTTIV